MNNISNNISSLSSSQLLNNAKSQLKGKTDQIKQSTLSRVNQLKQEIEDLTRRKINIEKTYGNKFLQLQKDYENRSITEEEKNQKYSLIQSQKAEESELLNNEIQRIQNEISDSLQDELKDIKAERKKLNNRVSKNVKQIDKGAIKANVSRNIQVLKNTVKDKIAPIVINLLTNLAIDIIKKNSRLQELVDKTNEIIDAADTIEKINQARILRNNALNIINNQEVKITRIRNVIKTIQRIIEILNTVLTIIQLILRLPYPFLIPIKIKLQPTLQRITKILNELSIGLAAITSVLNDIIAYLEDLKSQLRDLGTLIEAKTADPTINAEQFLQDLQFNQPDNVSYKGFKFAIREESGPNAIVVKGYKRRYAVAIDTNNVDVLRSELSFTQDPQDLIDTLKIIIDRENLIA